MYDVIVVGGGPGGAVAAQRCAQMGFRTLLIERRRLPRDKVCSGMVMGPWANEIIQQEFGEIPMEVLASPGHLAGHLIHVPGVGPQMIEYKTPLAWRKDLDFWMILLNRIYKIAATNQPGNPKKNISTFIYKFRNRQNPKHKIHENRAAGLNDLP